MSKSGRQYGDEVRELRASGFDFPASRGYTLANPSQWSSGQKAAVTRAFNRLEDERDDFDAEPEGALEDEIIEAFFDDASGDNFEEWDDIEFFDEDEADDLMDEEADDYEEAS